MRKVSCSDGWQWCYAGWETICEKFPAVMEGMGAMADGKLYAKSFLPRWMAVVPWRMGNCMQKVSCRDGRQWCYARWESDEYEKL